MALESWDKRINIKDIDLDAVERALGPSDADPLNSASESDFKLKFEGKLNQVDASTLGYSLVNVTTIIREINNEVGTSRIDIKVKATAPGSFIVHLGLEPLNDPLFQANLVHAGMIGITIIRTLTDLLNLRKALKGEPPKEISQTTKEDEIKVKTGDNSTVTIDKRTYHLHFDNPTVNDALSKVFKTLDTDESIEGFKVMAEDEKSLFEAGREDFAPMALTTSVPRPESKDTLEVTQVHIVKASFDPRLKWEVLYKGNRTSVWLRDKAFQRRIEKGEKFAKGDVLAVTLRIHQKLDKTLGTYVNKKFEIVKVSKHIPRAEETNLFPDLPGLRIGYPAAEEKHQLQISSSSEADQQPEPDLKPKRKISFDEDV
jgi:hypothetical protein